MTVDNPALSTSEYHQKAAAPTATVVVSSPTRRGWAPLNSPGSGARGPRQSGGILHFLAGLPW